MGSKTKATNAKADRFDLDAIRVALDDDDARAALTAALVAWRQTRATALADLVDAIGARIDGPAIADDAAWSATARGGDPGDVGRLLAAIPDRAASFLPTAGAALEALPDDPRIAMAVATWTLDPPTTSSSTHPFWTRSIAAMTRAGDARVIPVLKKRLKQPKGGSQFWPKLYTALEKAIPKIESTPRAPVDAKAVDKLVTQAGKLAAAAPRRAKVTAAPSPGGPPLAQATTHLAAGHVAAAIDAMCTAWRADRVPAIADAIDRANQLLPAWDRPLGATDKAMHEAWLTAFADDALGNLPPLLEHVMVGGPAGAERHLLELASLPDDPRIARRLAELCGRHPASPERTQFWKSLLELIARTADGRTAPALRISFHDFTGTYYNHHRQARRIIGEWAMSPPVPPALGPKDTAELAAIDAALAKLERARDTTERDLLKAICDAWADPGPRLVYADWLTERGHPRGEAIVLACKAQPTAAESKRLREMLRKTPVLYGYLDDLGQPWAEDRHLGLDRGLPTQLAIDWKASPLLWQRVVGYPLMSLVETIAIQEGGTQLPPVEDFARVLLDPTARRLTKVADIPKSYYDDLAPHLDGRWKVEGRHLLRA